jgi:hypothetical protein
MVPGFIKTVVIPSLAESDARSLRAEIAALRNICSEAAEVLERYANSPCQCDHNVGASPCERCEAVSLAFRLRQHSSPA